MGNSYSSDMSRLLGNNALQGSSLARKDGDIVHFLVPEQKQPNYLYYCNHIEPAINPIKTINEYTEHTTEHYARVNLALASDSDKLQDYGDYISQLRSSILTTPLLDDCLVYRGVNLTDIELQEMERLQKFFIPSFTSTSIDSTKAYAKSSTMVIKLPYACKYACSITEKLSKYYTDEREILLSCYSAFQLERIEKDNNTNIISLYLDEHLSSLSSLTPISLLEDEY